MSNQKEFLILLFEIIVFLFIGYIFTVNILAVIYESFDIRFTGNVWINWFGVSYILFSLNTIIYKLSRNKNNYLINGRVKSIVFWALLIVAIYTVTIPFVTGENPF
ncbi:hypothetical protein [Paenisporosarcina indica]|uniref:hypothetical protein n=1 Tax=Paenisporosarcina indica TaxID=650093 RepID=UPI00094FE9B2|nr:hypothetical protein [Paenisporosarcina indica]